jgi:hypothetical protein
MTKYIILPSNIPEGRKIDIKLTNIIDSQAFQNIPQLGFLASGNPARDRRIGSLLLPSRQGPLLRGHVLPLALRLVLRIVRVFPLLVEAVALTVGLKKARHFVTNSARRHSAEIKKLPLSSSAFHFVRLFFTCSPPC